ncbi:MAG: hypothetical protein IJ106_11990 [Parasporobacterium sp.]|nr:hypothetical protein [Parasporobacterium sp.]
MAGVSVIFRKQQISKTAALKCIRLSKNCLITDTEWERCTLLSLLLLLQPLLLLRPPFLQLTIPVTAANKVRSGGVYRNAAFFRQVLPKISRIAAIFRQ